MSVSKGKNLNKIKLNIWDNNDEPLYGLACIWFNQTKRINLFKEFSTKKLNFLWKNIWFAKGKTQIKIDKELIKYEILIEYYYYMLIKKGCIIEYDSIYSKIMIIILFDQITRNIYRGTNKAYKYDKIGLKLCKEILIDNNINDISTHFQIFILMPLIHSENINDIKLAKKYINKLYSYPYEWCFSIKGILQNHFDRISFIIW